MKRKAFTLAEALVALAIVGIVAAVTASAMNRFKPDANKVIYLKNYDAIVEVVGYLTNSNIIYPMYNSDEQRELYKDLFYDKYPLYNTAAISTDSISASAGAQKFCELLAVSLNAIPSTIACNNTDLAGTVPSFTTKTGEDYIVSTTIKDPEDSEGYYKSEILLDLNGLSNGSNTTYETNTNDPDRFNLVVYATGQVRATDTKGLFYLTTRSSWRKGDDPEQSTYIGAQPELESFKLEWRLGKLPELPEGEKWADWVDLDNLRTTDVKGIYCEMQRPGRNDFNMQRHAYFHPEAQAWVELEGVYLVSNSEQSNVYYPEREQYDKDDVDRICVYNYYGKCTNR